MSLATRIPTHCPRCRILTHVRTIVTFKDCTDAALTIVNYHCERCSNGLQLTFRTPYEDVRSDRRHASGDHYPNG